MFGHGKNIGIFILLLGSLTFPSAQAGDSTINTDISTSASHIDFAAPDEGARWRIINDTVMGGRSTASAYVEQGRLHFFGQLSLQNNGGFASIRRFEAQPLWSNEQPLQIKVKGDGRRYQFRLRSSLAFDGIAYVTEFTTQNNVEQIFSFPLDAFEPRWRGRIVSNAPPLSFTDVNQLGFMLADKQPGAFALVVYGVKQTSPN